MPYNINNPPTLIKSLPQGAKKIWIEVFNSTLNENETNETQAIQAAWGAIKKAGYKRGNDGNWRRWK